MPSPVITRPAPPEQLTAALIRLCERELLASYEIPGVLAASLLVAGQSTTALLVVGHPSEQPNAADPRVQEVPVESPQAKTGSPE